MPTIKKKKNKGERNGGERSSSSGRGNEKVQVSGVRVLERPRPKE